METDLPSSGAARGASARRDPTGRFRRDTRGTTAVEYALIVFVLAFSVIGGVKVFSGTVTEVFASVTNSFAKTRGE